MFTRLQGSYEAGRLANAGKNYWSIEPTVGAMYLNPDTGIECSMFSGLTFNTENTDTDYHSGTQWHFEGTVAQHFPLWDGLAGVGANGFWYQQLQGDSGSGTVLGDFKAQSVGVGPVVSYSKKLGGHDVTMEAKWLHEIEVKNRLEGNYFWFKLLYKF